MIFILTLQVLQIATFVSSSVTVKNVHTNDMLCVWLGRVHLCVLLFFFLFKGGNIALHPAAAVKPDQEWRL